MLRCGESDKRLFRHARHRTKHCAGGASCGDVRTRSPRALPAHRPARDPECAHASCTKSGNSCGVVPLVVLEAVPLASRVGFGSRRFAGKVAQVDEVFLQRRALRQIRRPPPVEELNWRHTDPMRSIRAGVIVTHSPTGRSPQPPFEEGPHVPRRYGHAARARCACNLAVRLRDGAIGGAVPGHNPGIGASRIAAERQNLAGEQSAERSLDRVREAPATGARR